MSKTTFWDIIEKTLEKVGTPLSAKEIWEKANELKTKGDYLTTGLTPWNTIAAYCYTDINKNGNDSMIIQTSNRPPKFFLRKLNVSGTIKHIQEDDVSKIFKNKFSERDLHPLLVSYAFGNGHFKANLKTVFHENSSRATKGQNEWLHPDLVGVYFSFRDYKNETLDMQRQMSTPSIKLFSFELKISLGFANLRESYFQAVSNSSWANEGYLVTLDIDDDASFKDEVRRLNNAFGIGIIKLNPDDIFESEILFPSKSNQEIDWDTVNRLAKENSSFNDFLKLIIEDSKLGKVKKNDGNFNYDEILNPEKINEYVKNKGISAGEK